MSKQQEQSSQSIQLWIGLAKVEQPRRNGVLGDADQAFTNVIAAAKNRTAFRALVKRALTELGLRLIRLENAETLDRRLSKYSINEELLSLVKQVQRQGNVGFSTFHAFDRE